MSLKEKFEQIDAALVKPGETETVPPNRMQRELRKLYKGKPRPEPEAEE